MKKFAIGLVVVLLSGCASTRDWWENNIHPVSQPKDHELVKGLMATDWGTLEDPKNKREEAWTLHDEGVNTIYFVLDLPVVHDGLGIGVGRPHIEPGRGANFITVRAEINIEYWYKKGFRVVVVCGNEPSVRRGQSEHMPGLNYQKVSTSQLYTSQRLEWEKQCVTDLINKCDKYLFGIVLYLEPSRSESKDYCRKLATHIRATGFNGRLYRGPQPESSQ